MASQLYPHARELFLTGQLSWISGVVKAVLLPEGYIPNFDNTHLEDIFVGSRIVISEEVTGRTAVNGVADSDAVAFGLLVDSRKAGKIVFFKDTGVEATSTLIVFLDTTELVGTPVDLIGFEYFFVPDDINGGLFRL